MLSVIESLFNHQNIAISLYQAFLQILCTLLLLWAFKKYLYPSFNQYLDKREKFVNESVEKIKVDKENTEKSYLEAKLEKQIIKDSKKEILDDAHTQAKSEAHLIVEESKTLAKDLLKRGEEQLETQKAQAQIELEKEMLEMVSLVSKRFITENLSDEKEAKMIDDAIAQVLNG